MMRFHDKQRVAPPIVPLFPMSPALTSLSLKPIYRATTPLMPLQFPSVEEFVAVAERLCQHDVEVQGLSATTLALWHQSLHVFVRFLGETKNESAFLGGEVQRQLLVLDEWVRWLRQRNVSHVTVRTYWGALTAIGQRLERGIGIINPWSLLTAPRAGRHQPRVLTRQQAERVLTVVAHYQWETKLLRARNLAVIGCMLLAGLRRGEVLRLRYADVNIDAAAIFIRGGKGRYGGKDRTAYMPPQLQSILRVFDAERGRATPRRTHPEFLTSARRDAPANPVLIRRLFERVSAIVKFRVSPHMLRHTYATLLRQSGIEDRVSMDLMGHESLTMLKRYSHVFEGEYAEAVKKLHLDVAF